MSREEHDLGPDFDFQAGMEISGPQKRLLDLIDRWDGDLAPDAEEAIGCRGEAFWNVVAALRRKGLIIDGAWGTYPLTELGESTLARIRAHAKGQPA